VGVNEEILFAFIERFSGPKGIIIPIERSDWVSPHAIRTIAEICKEKRTEISFPKPFCSFNPSEGILKDFRKQFRIGKPEVAFTVTGNRITEVKVLVSAPCGATYFTARGLKGKAITDNIEFIIDNRLSSFPCTADTAVDRDFRDSITHEAVKIQRSILAGLQRS
jgi:hypothetical protein